jgi:hypothetical protein
LIGRKEERKTVEFLQKKPPIANKRGESQRKKKEEKEKN